MQTDPGLEDIELSPAPAWAKITAGVTRRLPRGKSRFIKWLCRGSDRRFAGRMARQLGGCTFDCSLQDMVARNVFFAGCSAAQEIAFVRGTLKPGMNFVDVGANWGLFTLAAARLVGSSGRVIALEPDPRILQKLKANIRRNGLRQAQVLAVAAADCDSNLLLAAHDHAGENWGISRLIENVSAGQTTFTVPSRRLDSLLDEAEADAEVEATLGAVDLVKIDVEGAEDRVLTGMEPGLTSHRYRRILLEFHPLQLGERGKNVNEIVKALLAKVYQGYSLDYSEAGIRRAYYHPWLHYSEFVRPLEQGMTDAQPRTIWLARGEPALI
jgi:FkbM family methyltransferase